MKRVQLWGSQGLEPESPKLSITPVTPFLLYTHSCLSGVMVSFAPANRFFLHGKEYGQCQLNSLMGKACTILTALGRALIGLGWATRILDIWGMMSNKWPSGHCCSNSVARRLGWAPRRRAWGSVLGTQSCGYHPRSPDQPQRVLNSVLIEH